MLKSKRFGNPKDLVICGKNAAQHSVLRNS
jgi:hypothetical protein